MLLYGIFGKFGAFFTSIPLPVLGGMSTFLFANIAVSGIKVMTTHGIDRRARFILAIAGSFGLGTIIIPDWFTSGNFLDCPAIENEATRGVCDAVILTLSTGYAVGCLVALFLNAVLPADEEDESFNEDENTELVPAAKKDVEATGSDLEKEEGSSSDDAVLVDDA